MIFLKEHRFTFFLKQDSFTYHSCQTTRINFRDFEQKDMDDIGLRVELTIVPSSLHCLHYFLMFPREGAFYVSREAPAAEMWLVRTL